MSDEVKAGGMGWLRDYPDMRDYTAEHAAIQPLLKQCNVNAGGKVQTVTSIDLRQWCSPIENQGDIGSCTAHAAIGLVEYFERRAFGRYVDASRLFQYKTERNLMGVTGDTGAFLRTAMQALVLFGVPEEKYCPYETENFDAEPSAFLYAMAANYKAVKYFRLDPVGTSPAALLATIKANLAAGLPSMFGFSVYDSYTQANTTGKIPFPTSTEQQVGGHAIMAVGYDDKLSITNATPGAQTTTGALLIRNSWSTAWGGPMQGYGWLPYEYVLRGLATDWWAITQQAWVDSGAFG